MLRRLVNIFKRGETAIKTPQIEKTEITIKQGKKVVSMTIDENINRFELFEDTKGKKFVISMEEVPEQTTIENQKSASLKKEGNIMESVKGFNSITTAAAKITTGAAMAGAVLINNSQHQDSEVKKVASSKAEDIFNSDIF